MSSLIIKELIKFVKKKFAADKANKSEAAKTAECERLFPPSPRQHHNPINPSKLIPALFFFSSLN